MDISAQMLIFATVVEQGSISAAARTMGQTPSAVSKQIGLLEDQVHYRLQTIPQRSWRLSRALDAQSDEPLFLCFRHDGVVRRTALGRDR